MFVIRQAMPDDLSTLLKLAKMVHFLNLPADRDLIAAKIARSRRSFAGQEANEREREFMFVLEDADTGSVVGTCCAIGRVGWPGWPHVFLQVRRREHWSSDLQQGITHVTVEFGTEESGFSEVGGLILAPGYRGHKERLGSLLSLVRFHFMGLHRDKFHKRVLAELMGPVTPDSRTLLWEYLGRRFINLSYQEADLFCQHSKEFMTSLWPRGEIHASILPPDARALIGKVGEETVPAKVLLERQGFKSTDHVDPFDGGPYLAAQRDARRYTDGLMEIFEQYADAIITLSAPGVAPRGLEATGDPVFCSFWTLTGLPSLNLPLLADDEGLPIGVQLVGAPGRDEKLLRTARALLDTLSNDG